MNGRDLSFSSLLVKVIFGCCIFWCLRILSFSVFWITAMMSSTNCFQTRAGVEHEVRNFSSKSSMNRSAITGETGKPIATPSCCWHCFSIVWKHPKITFTREEERERERGLYHSWMSVLSDKKTVVSPELSTKSRRTPAVTSILNLITHHRSSQGSYRA